MKMETKEFFHILFNKVENSYLGVPVSKDGSLSTQWFTSSQIDELAEYVLATGKVTDTYYCISPKKEKLPSYSRGASKDTSCVIGAWADYDVLHLAHKEKKLPNTKEEVLEFIEKEIPYKPTFLIWSGHGLHAIWLFEKPYIVEDDGLYISKLLKGWERFINSKALEQYGWKFDPVSDLARMLRAPGTLNFKEDEHMVCEVLEYNDVRYKVDDFEKYASDSSKPVNKVNNVDTTDDFDLMGTGSAQELISKCEFLQYCRDI